LRQAVIVVGVPDSAAGAVSVPVNTKPTSLAVQVLAADEAVFDAV
jgi:hypothetical protein